jgi:hypothetical protein
MFIFNPLFLQIIAAVFYTFVFFAFWGLYATFVCIACSQLEKLRASLLDIRQRQDTAERDSGADTDQEEEGQVHSCLQPFRHMQEQLNDCVRHHQQILRYAITEVFFHLILLKQLIPSLNNVYKTDTLANALSRVGLSVRHCFFSEKCSTDTNAKQYHFLCS